MFWDGRDGRLCVRTVYSCRRPHVRSQSARAQVRAPNLSSSFFSPRSTLLVGRCQRCQRCRDGQGGERGLGSLLRAQSELDGGGFFLFFRSFVMTSLLVLNVLNCHLRTPNQTLLYSRFQIWGRGRAAVVTHGTMVRNRRIELKGESPSTRLSPSERGLRPDGLSGT